MHSCSNHAPHTSWGGSIQHGASKAIRQLTDSSQPSRTEKQYFIMLSHELHSTFIAGMAQLLLRFLVVYTTCICTPVLTLCIGGALNWRELTVHLASRHKSYQQEAKALELRILPFTESNNTEYRTTDTAAQNSTNT